MIGRRLVLIIILVAGPAPAHAQQPLTLADAQAEARARAPEVGALEAIVRGAEAIAAQASRMFRQDPTVSGSYFNGALIGRSEENSWTLGAQLPVDVSGSWRTRSASATADVKRTEFDRENGLRALDEQVAVAVADVALQQRLIERDQRLLNLYAIAADGAHQQLNVGQGAQLDADSADLDLGGARILLEQVRGDLARARTRLARLLGRGSGVDLVVADLPEPAPTLQRPDLDALVERDPRVRAALAEIDAATFERETFARLVRPMPTFGLSSGYNRSEIPTGSFSGTPFAGTLRANWPDRDLVFNVSLPIPLFDRQVEPRARATGRLLTAEARARTARADVRTELESAWAAFDAATRALQAVADTPTLIDRDAGFVEQAVRAGAFDAVTRSLALRRLDDAGRRVDTAVRDLRAARAAWLRRILLSP